MRFIPEPAPGAAQEWMDQWLMGHGGCRSRMLIGPMAAIHPMGQALLRECVRRGIEVDLLVR